MKLFVRRLGGFDADRAFESASAINAIVHDLKRSDPRRNLNQLGELLLVPGREAARVVEVHGAGSGRVHEPFQGVDDLVGALRVPCERGEFSGWESEQVWVD